jgi:hypothetical protein
VTRYDMVAFIVLVVMIASVLRAWIKYRSDRLAAPESSGGGGDSPEALRLRDEVKQLRDRISVLERITVEKENSLERQIEALRDR